jgi:hypothetical protein
MEKSFCYNPFMYFQDENDVMRMVTNLFKATTPKGSQAQDPFWDNSASMLLSALVFYLWLEAPTEEQNFKMVMELLRAGDVREEDEAYISPLDDLFLILECDQPDHIAVKYYKMYRKGAGVIRFNGLLNQKSIIYCSQGACGTGERTPHHGYKPEKENLMELEYVQAGDYLLPNIILSERPGEYPPIGRYGKMRRVFLKEHCPVQYSRLVLTEQLFLHLRTVDEIADERRKSGVPESLIIKEIICEL